MSKLFTGLLLTVLLSAPCVTSGKAQDRIELSALPAKVTEYKEAKAKYESSGRDVKSYQDLFDMKNKVLQELVAKLKEYDPQTESLNRDVGTYNAEVARQREAIRQRQQSCAGVKAGSAQAAACQAKAAENNAWRDRLNSEKGRLDSRRSLLMNSEQALQENIRARADELEPIKKKLEDARSAMNENAEKFNTAKNWLVVARTGCVYAAASGREPDKGNCLSTSWADFGLPAMSR
jgi:chromosome segregation ATPase